MTSRVVGVDPAAGGSLLGPLMLGLIRYRTSPTTLNQLLGSAAAALIVVAPPGFYVSRSATAR
jgi:hypothetical protein